MDKFVYKATLNKRYESGEMEGRDADEIASKLKEKGYEILSIHKKKPGGALIPEGATKSFLIDFRE